jgi:glycosyltransferase involved in cell wall biosynthesis
VSNLDVSVIIPTYNRKESLCETLGSLCIQSWPRDRFEVLVVDDGSTDSTSEVASLNLGLALRYFYQSNQGSAIARNTGAERARGSVLIFLDDDMLVESGYVGGLIEEHRCHERIVGMGVQRPYVPVDATPFARIRAGRDAPDSVGPDGTVVDFTACVTNNLSVERDDFFEIGMMQDVAGDGPTWWGDVDFGYRAMQLGFQFLRSGKAVCYHRDHSVRDLATASARAHKVAMMAVKLFQKHPGIVSYLPMFEDKLPVSWRRDTFRLVARKLARRIASTRLALRSMEAVARALEKRFPFPALLRPLYRWIIGSYVFRGLREGLRASGLV